MRIALAAILYVAIVFAAGFVLGAVRVLVLEPRVGETIATLCEAPFLLTVMVLAARWLPARLGVTPAIGPLAAMGIGALVLQQLTDVALGGLLRGMTLREQLAHLTTPAGFIYLTLVAAFPAMPVLANWPNLRRPDAGAP
jgi:hypothetical protein